MKSKLCGTKQTGTLMNKSKQAWKTNTGQQEENKQSQKMAPDEQINSGGPTRRPRIHRSRENRKKPRRSSHEGESKDRVSASKVSILRPSRVITATLTHMQLS